MSRPSLATQLGFYGVFYLIVILISVLGYGPAQEYAKPITDLIFPVYKHNSLWKTLIGVTVAYWGLVAVFGIKMPKKDKNDE